MISPQGKNCGGFPLLELVIVIAVIAILAVLALPAISGLRARAQRIQCTANLRSLFVGADLFLQQNGVWPQIHPVGADESAEDFANAWIAALEPFHVPRKSWICPTIQDSLQNPDYMKPDEARLDYIATPFDDKPTSPHEWPTQPWFIERGDVHGNGNLIVFTDGSIRDLTTVLQSPPSTP